MSILTLSSISKSFSKGNAEIGILSNLNFSIESGEVVCIVGPSGSGKTTFLQIAGLLDPPSSGSVLFDGIDCSQTDDDNITKIRGKQIGFIYQFHNLLPELTALENVMLPLLVQKTSWSQASKKSKQLLQNMGLSSRLHHTPNQLSGGEQQRVAIARALITEPKLILADEPTGNLDSANAQIVIDLIMHEVKDRGIATVIVTHNYDIAKKAHRTLTIESMQNKPTKTSANRKSDASSAIRQYFEHNDHK